MRAAVVALVTVIAFLSTVMAQSRKVLVLPLDGTASPAQKSQLHDSIVKLAKERLAGDVTTGETTFADAATAVGCDPAAPECAETVRSTLGVDELVYGAADTQDGETTVTVQRSAADAAPASQTATLAVTDAANLAEPALAPLFGGASETAPAGPAGGSAVAESPPPKSNFFDTRERKLGFGLAAGGAIALVIGLSFWASKSDLQDEIDRFGQPRTREDFLELQALEDRAGSRALWGNIMVVLGVGLGGAGAYFLYKDHKNRGATLTPAPVDAGTGMTFVLQGQW